MPPDATTVCRCSFCLDRADVPYWQRGMVTCRHCGNKRCPMAAFHGHTCTGSNDPDQPGSNYADEPCDDAGCAACTRGAEYQPKLFDMAPEISPDDTLRRWRETLGPLAERVREADADLALLVKHAAIGAPSDAPSRNARLALADAVLALLDETQPAPGR